MTDARRSRGYLSIDAGINATSSLYERGEAEGGGLKSGSQRTGFVGGSVRMDRGHRAPARALSWVSLSNRAAALKKHVWTLFSEEDGPDLPLVNSIVQV